MSVLRRIAAFLWEEKIWWMTPLIGLLVLIVAFVLLTESSAILPIVYDLF